MKKEKLVIVISWIFSILASIIFLNSLFYKFNPVSSEPAHIFSTIGLWMNNVLGETIGYLFSTFGQYVIGGGELVVSLILLSPLIFSKRRALLHCVGGVLASVLMAGAVFFHLFTPLGWYPTWCENIIDGEKVLYTKELACRGAEVFVDSSLANFALAILILGITVAILNRAPIIELFRKKAI